VPWPPERTRGAYEKKKGTGKRDGKKKKKPLGGKKGGRENG